MEGIDAVDGYSICCEADEPPDCEGVCGGSSMIDTCNVCKGNDTGILCPTGFVVDTGANVMNSNHHLATSYDAINASYVSLVPVTVFNSFNTSVFVSITTVVPTEFAGLHKYGPVFTLSDVVEEVEGYGNFTFFVASNMSGLFSGALSGWEVKTLSLR